MLLRRCELNSRDSNTANGASTGLTNVVGCQEVMSEAGALMYCHADLELTQLYPLRCDEGLYFRRLSRRRTAPGE